MRTISTVYITALGMQANLGLLLLYTFISLGLFIYLNTYKHQRTVLAQLTPITFYLVMFSLLSLGCLFLFNFICYLTLYQNFSVLTMFDARFVFKSLTIFKCSWASFTISLYGYILIFLAFFVGFFSLLTNESKIKSINLNFIFYFNYFLLIVYLFVTINDIIGLFICYELLLIPSFLFVYSISYTKKALQASLYFVIWTQLGSLLVLIAIVYWVTLVGDSTFELVRGFKLRPKEGLLIYTLLFFGFGAKFPLWPFHYWLTKTHVEASSGFSIYLSGFLVKSALFGFFTLTNLMRLEFNTTIFMSIAFLGALDASLKMWGQSDLKKLVAYCTIQEMNIIIIAFLLGDTKVILAGILFSAAHAFLSTLMFYLVDCIYRRTHSRSVYQVQGLIHRVPNLGIFIFIMCVLYAGLPGTLKFLCEFLIFSTLSHSFLLSTLIVFFITNVIGLIGFTKPWFNVLFGLPSEEMKTPVMDLSRREIFIILFPITFFFFFTTLSFVLL